MENIKAIEAVKENDSIVVHCHHNVNARLTTLVGIFEEYGCIKLIEPRYSFQGIRLGTTKVQYLSEKDALIAVNAISKKGQQMHQKQPKDEQGTIVPESLQNTTRSDIGKDTTAVTGTIKKNLKITTVKKTAIMKKGKESKIEGTTKYEDLEINASEENPFYAIHEWGRKIYIMVPEGFDYTGVFKGMRQYGQIEYIHMTRGKDQKWVALICYYDKESAQKALKQVQPICKPQQSYPQKIIDFKGKIYRLHEDCNRKVSAINFLNHKRTCALEQQSRGANLQINTTKSDTEKNYRTLDEKGRRLLVDITAEDDITTLEQEFSQFGLLEYIRPIEDARIAYVCYFQSKSAYRAILDADQKYKLRTAQVEKLTGFKGPLKSECSRCKLEIAAPHKAYHMAICRGKSTSTSNISDRLKQAQQKPLQISETKSIEEDKKESDSRNSFYFHTDNTEYDVKESYHSDSDSDMEDNRSVIIEGELYQKSDLCTIEEADEMPKPESDLVFKDGIFFIPQREPDGRTKLIQVEGLSLDEDN